MADQQQQQTEITIRLDGVILKTRNNASKQFACWRHPKLTFHLTNGSAQLALSRIYENMSKSDKNVGSDDKHLNLIWLYARSLRQACFREICKLDKCFASLANLEPRRKLSHLL